MLLARAVRLAALILSVAAIGAGAVGDTPTQPSALTNFPTDGAPVMNLIFAEATPIDVIVSGIVCIQGSIFPCKFATKPEACRASCLNNSQCVAWSYQPADPLTQNWDAAHATSCRLYDHRPQSVTYWVAASSTPDKTYLCGQLEEENRPQCASGAFNPKPSAFKGKPVGTNPPPIRPGTTTPPPSGTVKLIPRPR